MTLVSALGGAAWPETPGASGHLVFSKLVFCTPFLALGFARLLERIPPARGIAWFGVAVGGLAKVVLLARPVSPNVSVILEQSFPLLLAGSLAMAWIPWRLRSRAASPLVFLLAASVAWSVSVEVLGNVPFVLQGRARREYQLEALEALLGDGPTVVVAGASEMLAYAPLVLRRKVTLLVVEFEDLAQLRARLRAKLATGEEALIVPRNLPSRFLDRLLEGIPRVQFVAQGIPILYVHSQREADHGTPSPAPGLPIPP
jgi:hypothetical protein